MGVLDVIKKILGSESENELAITIQASDGCVGEKIIEKLKKVFEPC
jgi:hypothetical protein